MHQLLICRDGKTWAPDEEQGQFETARAAKTRADRLNADSKDEGEKTRYRVSVVPEDATDETWKQRERERFRNRSYGELPWEHEMWFRMSEFYGLHLAHVSEKDKTMVAYTASNLDGIADKQIRVSPGRYLKQFFGKQLSAPQIAKWAAMMGAAAADTELKFATTPKQARRVYDEGPHSCMAGAGNLAQVYGGGEGDDAIAVAYVERKGTITGRTVCWPGRKRYVRIYGDDVRLGQFLAAAGYRNCNDMYGAKIARVKSTGNAFNLPSYFDFPAAMVDEGDCLRLVRAGTAGSFVRGTHLRPCERCNRHFPVGYICKCVTEHCFYCGGAAKKPRELRRDLDDNKVCLNCIRAKQMRYAMCCNRYLPSADKECNCKESQIVETEPDAPAPMTRRQTAAALGFLALLVGATSGALLIETTRRIPEAPTAQVNVTVGEER